MATQKKSGSRKKTSARKGPAKRSASARTVPKRSTSTTTKVEIPQVPMRSKWDVHGIAYAFAVLGALDVLVVSLGSKWMPAVVEMYQNLFFSYAPSVVGTIAGMAEGAIYGLVAGGLLGWLYNKFSH